MKYITQAPDGLWVLKPYEDYVEQNRAALNTRLSGEDLLSGERNGFGRASLHDARVLRFSVDYAVKQARLLLLGAYYDRHFELVYTGLSGCGAALPGPKTDLLIHEVTLGESGGISHELLFSDGEVLQLACASIAFRDWPLQEVSTFE